MRKNKAQPVYVAAVNNDGRVSGIAATITAQLSIDGAAFVATTDVNPEEIGTSGIYRFNLTAAETNGDQIDLVYATSQAGVEIVPYPSHYPTPQTAAAVAASGSVTGGLANGTDVRVYQDDDVADQFALVFEISNPSIDFTNVSEVLFAAGQTPGTPEITGTATASNLANGSMTVTVAIPYAQLQGDPNGYPYTLKAVIASKRHTIHAGTLTLAATYLPFRS